MSEERYSNFYFFKKEMKHLTDEELKQKYQEVLDNGVNCWATAVGKQLMEQEFLKRKIPLPHE